MQSILRNTDFIFEVKMRFSEEMLASLYERVKGRMSEKRFFHTAEVEKMAARLGELYCPDKIDVLRAAALLHDVTKERTSEEHVAILECHGITVTPDELLAPKTLHAKSAAALAPDEYPEFATDEVVSCVRWHTTGRADMTLTEKLIYLADYIDMSRKFDDCVRLREFFFSALPEKMGMDERLVHLDKTLVQSFDMTMAGLIEKGAVISMDTICVRNELIKKLASL